LLAKNYRANPAEIILAREEGKLISGPLFSLLVFDLDDQRLPCFAFIVSTKIDKRAAKRNRIKRLLRVAVRQQLPRIKKGQIILFLARKNLLGRDLETVEREVGRMLRRGRLME